MTTYFSPGVYIEEVPTGPQPIAAAPTSVVAVLGRTSRGTPLRPTRITGWSDFLRVFGDSRTDSFTAEAVYGFFANGGPAAYVVRVDPSLASTWMVKDTAGADSFAVTATSPGGWANDLTLAVAPDTTGGQATTYRGTVTSAVTVTSSATAIQVDSTAGVAVGDTVVLARADGTATSAAATVTDIGPGTVTVTKSGGSNLALSPGDRVACQVAAGATTVRLAAGGGIKVGDLLLAQTGDGTRTVWQVTGVTAAGAGLVVTVANGAGSAVPGIQLADRIVRFRGTIGAPAGNTLALGTINWLEDPALRPTTGDMTTRLHAYAGTGMEGTWASGNHFAFPAPPPAGPVEVEAPLRAHRFVESTNLVNPQQTDLLARYSFVPEGTTLQLTGPDSASATALRTGTGFTVTGSLNKTFDTVRSVLPSNASKGVLVRCARLPVVGDRVAIGSNLLEINSVANPGGTIYVLGFTGTTDLSGVTDDAFPLRAFVPTTFVPLRFSLSVTGSAGSERFTGLALDPAHPRHYARDGVVNGVSTLVVVSPRDTSAGAPALATMPAFAVADQVGLDVAPGTADVKAGITALEAEPEPALVICPDLLTFDDVLLQADLVDALVRHCESFRRLAIVDAPDLADDQALLAWRNTTVASSYAAVYAPHLRMVNLDRAAAGEYRTVPPSGFVAGVMARTDRERGVHKAPGNEQINGIVGLAEQYTQRRQDLLNPGSVNLIRAFPGRGSRVWGARTATDDPIWGYVNVRRLFNFVETSMERGTQWVVFEPNTASTWLRIKASVEGFLDQLWRSGALAGGTAEQAYRVRVGLGQTMSEADIDLGLVVTEVAIAPAKPAEFVVFRFSHKRLSD